MCCGAQLRWLSGDLAKSGKIASRRVLPSMVASRSTSNTAGDCLRPFRHLSRERDQRVPHDLLNGSFIRPSKITPLVTVIVTTPSSDWRFSQLRLNWGADPSDKPRHAETPCLAASQAPDRRRYRASYPGGAGCGPIYPDRADEPGLLAAQPAHAGAAQPADLAR